MKSLFETLQDHDLGFFRIVAELWGVPEPDQSGAPGASSLTDELIAPGRIEEIASALPRAAQEALEFLLQRAGRCPWTDFTRQFGSIREVGPGRRDRERPWRSPQSPTEMLWYRALIGRQFVDTETGPREFAFVPREFQSRLTPARPEGGALAGSPAPTPDRVLGSGSRLVDDSDTLLAALRLRPEPNLPISEERGAALAPFLFYPRSIDLLSTLLRELGSIGGDPAAIDPDAVREFLTLSRSDALHTLGQAWRRSSRWNDLRLAERLDAPGGKWPNEPDLTRAALLARLQRIPAGLWRDLGSFSDHLRETEPGFARPGGEFDSWYLRDRESGRFLRGFEHWEAIEGALIHRVISGPLYWLGVVELGLYESSGRGPSFRLTDRAPSLLSGEPPAALNEAAASGSVASTGVIRIPRLCDRTIRYGVARMGAWVGREQDDFLYRVTPRSLDHAAQQGLTPRHFKTLIEEAGGGQAPPTLIRAIERHFRHGRSIGLQHGLVVKFEDPSQMRHLLKDRRISKMIKEQLGEHAALLHEGQLERFLDACAAEGVLAQPPEAVDSP